MIVRRDILMGRDTQFPLNKQLENNLDILLSRINHFEREYWSFSGRTVQASSGYRPGHYNIDAGGSPHSAHLTCEAIDLLDTNRAIKMYVVSYPRILEICDLYMEEISRTTTWIHLQTRAASTRIFKV
jgi:hypothetical protein